MKKGRIPAGFWYMLGAGFLVGFVTFASHMGGGDGVNIKFSSYEGQPLSYYNYAVFELDKLKVNNISMDTNKEVLKIGLNNANSTEDIKINALAFVKEGDAKTVLVSVPILDEELKDYIKSVNINGRNTDERELRLVNDEANVSITIDIDEKEFNKLNKYDSIEIPINIGDKSYILEVIKE